MVSNQADWQIFFPNSNFDLWYLCSSLINVYYLIWNIYFISVWILKPKAFEWLLRYLILAQSSPISIELTSKGTLIFFQGCLNYLQTKIGNSQCMISKHVLPQFAFIIRAKYESFICAFATIMNSDVVWKKVFMGPIRFI